jgi:hypothetical protein
MGSNRRETDAEEQDYTDSRSEGEQYTTVDKNYVVPLGFAITIAGLVVPLLWGVFKFDTRVDKLEEAIAGQGAYGWDREQAIRQWEGFADLNPSNVVPDPRDIGYHDPKSGRWVRPAHSPTVHP